MADFAFRPTQMSHGKFAGPDDDVLARHGEARRLQRHLHKAGHDAHIEKSAGGDEHRVWIQHPEHKDIAAYVARGDDVNKMGKPGYEPHWVRK